MIDVLVIDDDEVDLRAAERLVRKASVPVRLRMASSADEGVRAALDAPPHVILLDMNLGLISGEETVVALRAAGVDSAIVLLTGTSDPERVAQAIAAGAMKYVPKSALDVGRLEAAILGGARVTEAERRAAAIQRIADRRARQLEQLVEASVAIASETTLEGTAASTSRGALAMFETDVHVEFAGEGVEPFHHHAGADVVVAADELRVEGRGTRVALRFGRVLPADERLVATELARIALGSAINLALVREAQAAARDRQDIVAVVSHDLRTPLQSLSLGIDTLRLGLEAGRERSYLVGTTDRMRRSVSSMSRLLDDLLDVSRIHDRALRVQPSETELDALLAEVTELHQPLAEAKGLTVRFEPSALRARVDGRRIAQALSNLVTNALRHTERGGVTLRAAASERAVRIEVEDTGVGIAEDVRRRLFERLYQSATAGKTGALGLGLYIVRGIAEAHGGRAGVTSELGRGSRFFLELPRVALGS